MLACSFLIELSSKDIICLKRLKGFDFWHFRLDIGSYLALDKTMAFLLENYSKYFDDFSCWL